MRRVARLILSRPRLCAGLLVASTLAAALYLAWGGLRFDYDIASFLPDGDPTVRRYHAFAEEYEPDDAFLAVGFAAEDVFAPATLRDIGGMTAALKGVEGIEEVTSLTNVEHLRAAPGGIELAEVVGDLAGGPAALEEARRRAQADRFATGHVVNVEADATALFARIAPAMNQPETRGAVIAAAREALAPWAEAYHLRWSGMPYLRHSTGELIRADLFRSVLLVVLGVALVLLWTFRNVRGAALPLATILLGLVWTLAIIMFVSGALDVMTGTLAAIILVVGVADAVHLLAKFYDGVAEGRSKRAAIRQMIVRLGAATLLTSVTTAIGFATLATSQVVPIRRFGLYAAVGVLVTFALSLVLVAVALLWLPAPRPKQVRRLGGRGSGFARALAWTDGLTARRPWLVVAAAGVVAGLSVLGALRLEVNSHVNGDLGPRMEAYWGVRFFEDEIVPPYRFEVLLTADRPDAFKRPELLRAVESVQEYLQAQPHVRRVASVADLAKRVNQALHADSAAAHRLPERPDLAAQSLFLLELTDESLLRRFVNLDYSAARLSASVPDVGSQEVQRLRAGLEAFLEETLPPGVEGATTGLPTVTADVADYLVGSLLLSIGLALAFIAALMGVLFRSARLVVLSLIPNVFPLVAIAGIMGWAGVAIKPSTVVIFSIAFGIAVDDTIHVLARLRQELRAGHPLRAALHATLLGTGKALILTSLILAGGFVVLTTGAFQTTIYLGALLAATTGLALLADLFLLPALLHLFYAGEEFRAAEQPEASVTPDDPGKPPAFAERGRAALPEAR